MYSRINPSQRYLQLLKLYQALHVHGDPLKKESSEQVYRGFNIRNYSDRLKRLIQQTNAHTLLDYGAGKGLYWDRPSRDSQGLSLPPLKEYLGISEVRLYDPAYPPFQEFPAGQRFDGVVAMDVLEHCPEDDLPWILDELFGFSQSFLMASISCRPADRCLPNGENAHCTVRAVEWWENMIEEIATRYTGLLWEFWFDYRDAQTGTKEIAVFSNAEL